MGRRSKFNLSHEVKLTGDMGKLYPCLFTEVVPGDRFNIHTQSIVRFAPLVAPLMHQVDCYFKYFFVPNRLLFDKWEEFITGGESYTAYDPSGDPIPLSGDSVKHPTVTLTDGFKEGSLGDYFGLPVGLRSVADPDAPLVPNTVAGIPLNAFPFRAYNLIWNEYYRYPDLQDAAVVDTNIEETTTDFAGFDSKFPVRRSNWHRDYFTSALPFPQKGPSPVIPILGDSFLANFDENEEGNTRRSRFPVQGLFVAGEGSSRPYPASHPAMGTRSQTYYNSDGDKITLNSSGPRGRYTYDANASDNDNNAYFFVPPITDNDGEPNIHVNLRKSVLQHDFHVDVSDLRRAFQIQRIFELNARGGTRYVEFLKNHFGVSSPDARLQRPEFLGGHKVPVIFSEVLQTSASESTGTPQANMAGHGFSAGRFRGVSRSFAEHGVILGLMSVIPKANYQQGIPRAFLRYTRYDYLFPLLAHLSEQPVYNAEVYATYVAPDAVSPGAITHNFQAFGYQPRYQEYRRAVSYVCGDFRSSLSRWHLGRIFDTNTHFPGGEINPDAGYVRLNSSFLTCKPSTRPFAVETGDDNKLQIHLHNSVHVVRNLPKYGVPGFSDH